MRTRYGGIPPRTSVSMCLPATARHITPDDHLTAAVRRFRRTPSLVEGVSFAASSRIFHRRAGVHDNVEACCRGTLGGGFVDHAELQPHRFDA